MAQLKVLTLDNLDVIKNYIDVNDAKSLKTVAVDGNKLKFYRVSEPVGTTEPAYEIELPDTDLSGVLAKLTGATENNVVTVGANGTVKDSGIKSADLALKSEVTAVSDLVGVIPNGYDATTIAEYAKELADNVAANGYDDTDVKNSIGNLTTLKTTEKGSLVGAVNELSDGKANKATTIAGYGITDAYTKTEVDSAIGTAVANAEHLKRSIVTTLPEVASADAHTIYMVEITGGDGNQKYEEFMLINGAFEKIGDSAVDLTDYATKEYADQAEADAKAYTDEQLANITAIETSEIEALFTV
jgi:hypothetical protein